MIKSNFLTRILISIIFAGCGAQSLNPKTESSTDVFESANPKSTQISVVSEVSEPTVDLVQKDINDQSYELTLSNGTVTVNFRITDFVNLRHGLPGFADIEPVIPLFDPACVLQDATTATFSSCLLTVPQGTITINGTVALDSSSMNLTVHAEMTRPDGTIKLRKVKAEHTIVNNVVNGTFTYTKDTADKIEASSVMVTNLLIDPNAPECSNQRGRRRLHGLGKFANQYVGGEMLITKHFESKNGTRTMDFSLKVAFTANCEVTVLEKTFNKTKTPPVP